MANEVANEIKVMWNDVASTTDINCTLSKALENFAMGELEGARTDDQVYVPQEYRFNVQDGLTSTDGDFQDLIDRMIKIDRTKVKRVLFKISAKELRDPRLLKMAAEGVARDIRNAIDVAAYETAIEEGSLVHTTATDFDWQTATDIEVKMADQGLSAYAKKGFLSLTDYSKVAQQLGAYQYTDGIPKDALTKAMLPPIASFETIRADYRKVLPANTTTGVTVNGNQSHTPATYVAGSTTEFLDNRRMTLNVNVGTITNMPRGTKFTIAGINSLNPETREDTGYLQTFTVLSGTGSALTISPAIVTSGPYANCTDIANDTAAVTILNTAACAPSVFYTPESLLLVPGQLPLGGPGVDEVVTVTENGIPLVMTMEKDFHTGDLKCKGVVYFDIVAKHPERIAVCLTNQ